MKAAINLPVKQILKKFFGLPLTLLAFYFIGTILYSSLKDLPKNIHSINPILLILGVLSIALFFALKAYMWNMLLVLFNNKIPYLQSTYLLTSSEIRRYVPGNIFGFISRASNFKDHNVPAKTTVSLIIIESILLVATSLIVSIPVIPLIYGKILEYVNASFLAGLIIIGLTISGVLLALNKDRLLRQIKQFQLLLSPQTVHICFLSILSWIFFGLGNYCIIASFTGLDPRYLSYIISLTVFAWALGYLSFLTPMGLGVREAVIVFGLSSILPLTVATTMAVLLRVGFILGEILLLAITHVLNKNQRLIYSIYNKLSPQAWIVVFSAILYSIYFSYFTIQKHNNFFTGKFDLGNMDQTMWNTLHGRIFMFTDPDGTEIISRLAYHADFLLIFLSPLYLVWSDPKTLLILQSVVVAIGAVFVYLLGARITNSKSISAALSVSYLLNPYVQWMNSYDFHAVVLAMTFLLAAFYFLELKKWGWFIFCIILSVLTKENIYLITATIGLYLMVSRKNIKLGTAIFVSSVSIFLLIMKKLIPGARGSEHFALKFLSNYGTSSTDIIIYIITHPIKTITAIINNGGISYLIQLLLPLGFLSLFAPWMLVFAGPDLMRNFLSSNPGFRQVYYQYNAEIIPFLYISSIYGIALVQKRFKQFSTLYLVYFILGFALIAQYHTGIIPGAKNAPLQIFNKQTAHNYEIRQYLHTIPNDMKVAATNNVGAHLSEREYIFVIPQGIKQADYVIFLIGDRYSQPSPEEQKKLIEDFQNSPNYILEYHIGKFYSFKKI